VAECRARSVQYREIESDHGIGFDGEIVRPDLHIAPNPGPMSTVDNRKSPPVSDQCPAAFHQAIRAGVWSRRYRIDQGKEKKQNTGDQKNRPHPKLHHNHPLVCGVYVGSMEV